MIVLTGYNNGERYYIEEQNIQRVTDGHDYVGVRSFPWSEVEIFEPGGETKVLRVMESARNIGKLMAESIQRKAAAKSKEGKK